MFQEPGIADVFVRVLVAAVHDPEDAAVPAIGYLEKHGSVAQLRIRGLDDDHVRGEGHPSVLQVCRLVEVDDDPVPGIRDVHAEEHATEYPFVRAGFAEGLAPRYRYARSHFHPGDLRT